jgi:tRNA(fMet)-specific endonuclease VapC
MILILDTDYLTLIQRHTEPSHSLLRVRLDAFPQEDVRTTIVSFEEQMRGWLSIIARSKRRNQEVAAYQLLHDSLAFFSKHPSFAV